MQGRRAQRRPAPARCRPGRPDGFEAHQQPLVDINWLTMESTNTPGIHVLGDAIFPGPTMPKSGHMANQHAAGGGGDHQPAGRPGTQPGAGGDEYLLQLQGPKNVIHVASVHQYDAATRPSSPSRAPAASRRRGTRSKARSPWAGPRTSGPTCWADRAAGRHTQRPRACPAVFRLRNISHSYTQMDC